ncbi:MAG: 1-acyl-sn-glycerol-3-phosphate acyltransferase, partial [Kiritimatiellae bacterium]|nr:1-acyl-sn-glycerol-3-phosphate acyltransferase [Kiritimatiellia bacterium]
KNLACLTAPAVIVSNHMSLLETFLLPGFILPFREVAIVVKESLLRYPAFGQILRAVNAISVKRENPREDFRKIMECGRQALESGRCVLVFPQSTRSPEFNPAEFNSVGVKLAARSSVPVIPLALKTDFVGIGRIVRDLGRLDRSKPVYFSFGAPFQVTSPREAHEKVVAFISERLRSWGVKVYAEANKGIRELNEQHVD